MDDTCVMHTTRTRLVGHGGGTSECDYTKFPRNPLPFNVHAKQHANAAVASEVAAGFLIGPSLFARVIAERAA
jgi:hypothetical protein